MYAEDPFKASGISDQLLFAQKFAESSEIKNYVITSFVDPVPVITSHFIRGKQILYNRSAIQIPDFRSKIKFSCEKMLLFL